MIRSENTGQGASRFSRRAWLGLACLALLLQAGMGRAADTELSLRLEDAALYHFQRSPRGEQTKRVDLWVDVTFRNGRAEPNAWAFQTMMPGQEHIGRVHAATLSDDAATLQVEIHLNHSRRAPCMIGGVARYDIELQKKDGTWTGSYTGRCEDRNNPQTREALTEAWGLGYIPHEKSWSQPTLKNKLEGWVAGGDVKGRVVATVRRAPPRVPGFKAPKPNEHPRLLFRKDQLPTIRRRLKTPEGRKIMARIKYLMDAAETDGFGFREVAEHSFQPLWAAGYGLMYQLSGDRSFADRAQEMCQHSLYSPLPNMNQWRHSYMVMGFAITYDLCADAWAPAFRDMVFTYLDQNIRHLALNDNSRPLLNHDGRYEFANSQDEFDFRDPRHEEGVNFRTAAAIAALAIKGDSPPLYEPTPWERVQTIKPARDYQPWIGVPVVDFLDDRMFGEWLINGPFPNNVEADPLHEAGGRAKARPEPGDIVTVDGFKLDWRRYRPTHHPNHGFVIYPRACARYWASSTKHGYWPGIRLLRKWKKEGRDKRVSITIYTVLDNEVERVVQARPNWGGHGLGARMWVGGVELQDGDLARLQPGLYPILCHVPLTGGYANQSPKLREYTPADYAKDLDVLKRTKQAFNGRNAFGLSDTEHNLAILTRCARRYIRRDIGPDGWGGWGGMEHVLPFTHAYHNVMGEDLAANTGLTQLLHVATRLRNAARYNRNRMLDVMVSQGMPNFAPEQLGIAKWYLETHGYAIRRPTEGIMALATHPFDVDPVHPRERFDLARAFPSHGVHVFRSGWEDAAMLTLLDRGAMPYGSRFAAGALGLQGLGHTWVQYHGKSRRWHDRTVSGNCTLGGLFRSQGDELLHAAQLPDGSGTVTMRSGPFNPGRFYSHNGKPYLVLEPTTHPTAQAQRAVAVDYSGLSGAPLLVATVDRIQGVYDEVEKRWKVPIHGIARDQVKVDRYTATFTVQRHERRNKRNKSWMRTTVAAPPRSGVHFEYEITNKYGRGGLLHAVVDRQAAPQEKMEALRVAELADEVQEALEGGYTEGPAEDAFMSRLRELSGVQTERKATADGGLMQDVMSELEGNTLPRNMPPPTLIFTVTTIGSERPPKVTTRGDPKSPEVIIGRRVLRFDGRKILMSKR